MIVGKYVHVKDGVVDFEMEANPEYVFGKSYASEFVYTSNLLVTNNWLYDGIAFTEPHGNNTVEIPQSITPRQARLKLLEVGLLDDLEAVITTNRAWQIEWEYATEVKRDSPLIDAVATQAGLTSDQIDQMFIEASKL
jgi:hypothetical protein